MNNFQNIHTVAVYGLFKRTPKFRSPDSSSRMKTPICIRPTRAGSEKGNNNYPHFCAVSYNTNTDQLSNRLDGTKWEPARPEHHCSSAHSTRTSYYNRTASKRILAAPGDNVNALSNWAGSSEATDCSVVELFLSGWTGNPHPDGHATSNWWTNYRRYWYPQKLRCVQQLDCAMSCHGRVWQLRSASTLRPTVPLCQRKGNDCMERQDRRDRMRKQCSEAM